LLINQGSGGIHWDNLFSDKSASLTAQQILPEKERLIKL
jgi:hypothetical protein